MADLHNCMPCILRQIFPMGFPLVMYISLFCRHNSSTKYAYIKKSPAIIIHMIFAVCLTLECSAVILSIEKMSRMSSIREMYYDAAATGMGIIIISEMVYFIIFYRIHFEYLNITIRLIEHRRYFNIESLLTETYVRNSLRYAKFIIGYEFFHHTGFGMYRVYLDASAANCIIQIGRAISDITFHFIFVYGGSLIIAYNEMFRILFKSIETTLTDILNGGKEENKFKFQQLRNMVLYYLFMKKNFQHHVTEIGCLWVYIIGYGFAVVSPATFLIVLYNTLGDKNTNLLLLYDFGYNFHIFYKFCDYFYFLTAQKIGFLSEDLISFLYKYPLSKLSEDEACQVEMVVTTLVLEKPQLRASNIYSVGTNLISSISGNVVSYVLVAVQFNAAFSQ